MSQKDQADNPFAALFYGLPDQKDASKESHLLNKGIEEQDHGQTREEEEKCKQQEEEENKQVIQHTMAVNSLMENIFLITVDSEFKTRKRDVTDHEQRPSKCVFLAEMADILSPQNWLDEQNLEQAVFERLLMSDPASFVLQTSDYGMRPTKVSAIGEPSVLKYLFACFQRYCDFVNEGKFAEMEAELEKCKAVILLNSKTCLQQPDLYSDQQLHQQFLDLYIEYNDYLSDGNSLVRDFFVLVAKEIHANAEDGTVREAFLPVLEHIRERIKTCTIENPEVNRYIHLLLFFTSSAPLAQAFMEFTTPKDPTKGQSFESTLLGHIISLSCMPKNEMGTYPFFENPASRSNQEHSLAEQSIWKMTSNICNGVHLVMLGLIKSSPDVKHQMLSWIGKCLHANSGRAKLWSSHAPQLLNSIYCSDGFCLNLCHIMLKLCQPFSEPSSPKLLKIQLSYVRASAADDQTAKAKNIHSSGLSKETCLIPAEGLEELATEKEPYTFITECFFMTHQSIQAGFHNIHEKFLRLNRELHRIENMYRELQGQGMNEQVEPMRTVKAKYERGLTMYLTMKAALTEPQLLELCMKFHIATSTWLVQVARVERLTEFQPITFPLPTQVPRTLAYIPEFVMGNITDFTMFLHHFKDEMYQMGGENLEHFMTLILVFMGSPERMKNPHFRAELASTVNALLPIGAVKSNSSENTLSKYYRERLFQKHPLITHLAEKLLHVFVSIEVTGEAVQFEQKFNYREPMYKVLKYMWESNLHKEAIKEMAVFTEEHIEDSQPPLFLRFIHLLINDAIFLIDEGLDYMRQLRDKQMERETAGEMTNAQRQEFEANFRQLEMMARIHNQLASATITTLEMITQEIKSIFCNPVMVDRMTSMLSDFLHRLVGPDQATFKVKDMREKYKFKPDETVSNICKIYLQLGDSDVFCRSVVRDEKSYSVKLFPNASRVLRKINSSPVLISDFDSLHRKILVFGDKQKEEEDIVSEAPEKFLDPIMGTLMSDPVILPSGRYILDRAVLARHLLTDQTDPFNRQPLSLDMVTPDTTLKQEIKQWLEEQRAKKKVEREERYAAEAAAAQEMEQEDEEES